MRYSMLLLSTLLIGACSPSVDDLEAYTLTVSQRAVVNIEPYPEFKSPPSFTYNAHGLRSPFIRPKNKSAPVVQARQSNCIQPDFERPKEKLESYGLDALFMTGSFKSNGAQWALISSNDGILHKTRVGSRIGLFYGKITQINASSITIKQLLPDGAGCWQTKQTTLSTQSASGEQNNG